MTNMLIYNIYIIYIITYTLRLLCLNRSRVPSLGFSQGSFASVWLKSSSSAASHSDQLSKNRNIEAQIQENVGQIINASSKEQEYKNYVYPPTPAISRGSASEEALLATRCQKGRRVCAERKPAPEGHEQGGSWQCRNAGKVKVWS